MENNSDSVLEMYLYETNTLLEQLDNIMLSAEQADTLSEDDVNEIFRIMHTLKGSAAMMEFEPLMTIAHRIEDLFYLIREKTMEIIPEIQLICSSTKLTERRRVALPLRHCLHRRQRLLPLNRLLRCNPVIRMPIIAFRCACFWMRAAGWKTCVPLWQ